MTTVPAPVVAAALADPFVAALHAWLDQEGPSWSGNLTEAVAAGKPYATTEDWPTTASALGTALAESADQLAVVGITVTRYRVGTRRRVRLHLS